jgi:hypothetical protein
MFVKSVLVASVGAAIIMEAKKPNCSKFISNNWKSHSAAGFILIPR